MSLVIKGGKLVDPEAGTISAGDVVCRDGRIVAAGPDAAAGAPAGAEVFEAAGLFVTPGLIDMHVHLREPGFEYKEDVASGSRAAVVGGFTTIACMPNTAPVIDQAALVRSVLEMAARAGLANVLPIGSISKGLAGVELAELGGMFAAGAVGFSDDGKPVMNSELMRTALQYAKMYNVPLITHSEDMHLAADGQMHLGAWSALLGLRGIPGVAEAGMIARDCMLAELTGGRVHVAHVSTELSLSILKWAKGRGIAVTSEVTPHHLTLTDEEVSRTSYDTNTKMNPPLRSAADVAALKEGLRDGLIEVIASDHAPHSLDDKDVEFNFAANGIIGLETSLPVLLTKLVATGDVDLLTVVKALTLGPAKVLGLASKGRLGVGMDADLTLIDLDASWTIDPRRFESKSRNTPFVGWEVQGRAAATVVGGRVVQREGRICV